MLRFVYFLIITIFGSVSSTNILKPNKMDSDIKIISHVLNDIVNEFLVKKDTKFNILNVQPINEFSKDILHHFVSNSNLKFTVRFL